MHDPSRNSAGRLDSVSRGHKRLVGGVLLGSLALGRPALARETPDDLRRAIHVRYVAPQGCRTERAFAADLLRRTPRLFLADVEGPNIDSYDVRIEQSAAGTFVGSVQALSDQPGEPQRHQARTCADVASALALTLALSVDPDARVDAPPEPSALPSAASPPPTREAAPSLPPPTRTALALGLGGDVLGGAFDRPLIGLAAFAEARGAAGSFRYLARARLALLTSAPPPASPSAFVRVGWVGLDVCAFGQKVGPLLLWPCVGAEPGVATARARGVAESAAGTAFWLSASARGRADLALGARLGITVEVAALAPLVRPRFYIDPQARSLAEANAVAAEGAIGLWVHFP